MTWFGSRAPLDLGRGDGSFTLGGLSPKPVAGVLDRLRGPDQAWLAREPGDNRGEYHVSLGRRASRGSAAFHHSVSRGRLSLCATDVTARSGSSRV